MRLPLCESLVNLDCRGVTVSLFPSQLPRLKRVRLASIYLTDRLLYDLSLAAPLIEDLTLAFVNVRYGEDLGGGVPRFMHLKTLTIGWSGTPINLLCCIHAPALDNLILSECCLNIPAENLFKGKIFPCLSRLQLPASYMNEVLSCIILLNQMPNLVFLDLFEFENIAVILSQLSNADAAFLPHLKRIYIADADYLKLYQEDLLSLVQRRAAGPYPLEELIMSDDIQSAMEPPMFLALSQLVSISVK